MEMKAAYSTLLISLAEPASPAVRALHTLSVNKVGDRQVLPPPIAEQARIVAEVERRLSVVQELETLVETNLQRATRLRQSILARAFSDGSMLDKQQT